VKYSINAWDSSAGEDVGTGCYTSASTASRFCLALLCPRYPGGVSSRAGCAQTAGLGVSAFPLLPSPKSPNRLGTWRGCVCTAGGTLGGCSCGGAGCPRRQASGVPLFMARGDPDTSPRPSGSWHSVPSPLLRARREACFLCRNPVRRQQGNLRFLSSPQVVWIIFYTAIHYD